MAAQRDYAVRNNNGSAKKKKSSNMNKTLLIFITALVVAGFASTLYLLKEKAPASVTQTAADKPQPKSQLPSRPEEVWSYIKELESRTVVTDESQKALQSNLQLSEKQKEELRNLAEKEKQAAIEKAKQAEERRLAEEQGLTQKDEAGLDAELAKIAERNKTEQAKAAEQKKQAEQKKLAEQKKAEEAKKTEETKKAAEARKAEEVKKVEEAKKAEESKKAPAVTETVKDAQKTETAKAGERKFGLQCGAFKNKEQAENLKNRLVGIGLNARVNASADWNRVVVGPMTDRTAAVKAQQQAGSIIGCVVIGM